MNTAARVHETASCHWYTSNGEPMHEVPKKDGGMRRATLADARKQNLLRSVTSYLKVLAKPELEAWKIEQACLAVLTSPHLPNESADDFVKRVLTTERQQEQERDMKADLGKQLHDAMANLMMGQECDRALLPWVEPAFKAVRELCPITLAVEKVLVGSGYAGRCDFIGDHTSGDEMIVDWKSTGKLPTRGSWPEHVLQLSAYAAARERESLGNVGTQQEIRTANVYISTKEQGQFVLFENPPWRDTFEHGFKPIMEYVIWSDDYDPRERCSYCGALSEGQYSVHRDGFDQGPEVPLCNKCGAGDEPTLAKIWAKIAQPSDA